MNNQIKVSIEDITPSLLNEAKRLYAAEPYKIAIWNWQFRTRYGRIPQAIIARDRGRLVGFNATMPINLRVQNNDIIPAMWSCDFIVDPAYRGQGIGGKIKDEIVNKIHQPVMSLGISDSAYPILLKKGWQTPASLSVFQMVLVPATIKQWVLRVFSLLMSTLGYLIKKVDQRNLSTELLVNIPSNEIIASLLQRCGTDSEVVINKDYEYLVWRYQDFPLEAYQYLAIYDDKKNLHGLVVYRITKHNSLDILDYLGDYSDSTLLAKVVHRLRVHHHEIVAINWNCSSPQLRSSLILNGFIKKRYTTKFVVRSHYDYLESTPLWNLSSGDSDGDFLKLAKDNFELSSTYETTTANSAKNAYRFSLISEAEFLQAKDQWQSLIDQAECDHLFMSWEWMSTWWKTWASALNLTLSMYFIYREEKLIGILPLYKYSRGIFTYYQYIGNAWGVAPTVRSEYTSLLIDKTFASETAQHIVEFFKSFSAWSILVVQDALTPSLLALPRLTKKIDTGYFIDTTDQLADYQFRLGKNTRLKAFNRKDYLIQHYKNVEFVYADVDSSSLKTFFQSLNDFHIKRWGSPCFDEQAVCFHMQLLASQLVDKPYLTMIKIDGNIVSVSYNIQINDCLYNIQSGFIEEFDKKISLGTLHMGWMIAESFQNPTIKRFDFLAGAGKTEDYKRHYAGEAVLFYTTMYFVSPLAAKLFGFAKALKKLYRISF